MVKRAKPTVGGRRIPLLARTTSEMRVKLDKAAENSGRSLAQEVETRLEQSFIAGDILEKLFGGPKTFRMFLKTAMWLQVTAAEELKCQDDEWITRSDDAFVDRLADKLTECAIWEHDLAQPVAVKVTKSAEQPVASAENVRFATTDELAEFKPVLPQRAKRLRAGKAQASLLGQEATPAGLPSAIRNHPAELHDKALFDEVMSDRPRDDDGDGRGPHDGSPGEVSPAGGDAAAAPASARRRRVKAKA